MAFVLTAAQIYGVEAEEVVNKRYVQRALLTVTAANTDTLWDLGDVTAGSLGTFWDAVDGTTVGAQALQAFRDIQQRALSFFKIGGSLIGGYAQADASMTPVLYLDSAASTGGGASETLTVTGLAKTDVVIAAGVLTAGANAEALTQWESSPATADKLAVEFTGDPGAGAVVRAVIQRAGVTTPVAGTYSLQMDSTNTNLPNLTFVTGDAPTAGTLILEWVLKPGEAPVEYYGTAA